MGASLSEGRYRSAEGALECPWHGYSYSTATGELLCNPNDAIFGCLKELYQSYQPEKRPEYKLQAYSYELRAGLVHVRRPASL